MLGWKVLTHDWRSPIQTGGPPLFTGSWPAVLPRVKVDDGPDECAPGWNFCRNPETAFQIGGLWRSGWSSHLVRVDTGDEEVVERGKKCRVATLTLVREATPEEEWLALVAFSAPFGPHQWVMAEEQRQWRVALRRPMRDTSRVIQGLESALTARKLPWTLRQCDDVRRDARAVWGAEDAWKYAWDAMDAWDAMAAWDARAARASWDAWDAWDTWDTGDAKRALIVQYVRRMRWQADDPDAWTIGIRDAYVAGLGLTIPVASTVLGWSMAD